MMQLHGWRPLYFVAWSACKLEQPYLLLDVCALAPPLALPPYRTIQDVTGPHYHEMLQVGRVQGQCMRPGCEVAVLRPLGCDADAVPVAAGPWPLASSSTERIVVSADLPLRPHASLTHSPTPDPHLLHSLPAGPAVALCELPAAAWPAAACNQAVPARDELPEQAAAINPGHGTHSRLCLSRMCHLHHPNG